VHSYGVPERVVKVGVSCSDTEIWLNLNKEKFKLIIGVLFVVGNHYNVLCCSLSLAWCFFKCILARFFCCC